MLKEALQYIANGYSVVPLSPRTKIAKVLWTEFQKRRPTEAEIKRWWKMWPDSNIGLITGEISGLTVIDFDVDTGGLETLKTLKMPKTHIIQTGSGGFHYYYKYTDHVYTCASVLPGVDIRNNGGLVVAPPSIHESGNLYEVALDEEYANFPKSQFKKMDKARGEWKELIKGVPEGKRNGSAASLIGGLLSIFPPYLWEGTIWPLLVAWNTFNKPPMDINELRNTYKSIGKLSLKETWANSPLDNK